MNRVKNFSLFRWLSLALVISAVLLLVVELISFSRMRSGFTLGTTIANVPVGGLSLDAAADRITQAYSIPIEMHYDNAVIQVKPASLGFSLDLNAMITAATSGLGVAMVPRYSVLAEIAEGTLVRLL